MRAHNFLVPQIYSYEPYLFSHYIGCYGRRGGRLACLSETDFVQGVYRIFKQDKRLIFFNKHVFQFIEMLRRLHLSDLSLEPLDDLK